MPYIGEILSLLSALLWALAVIFFRKSGEKVHPIALNTFKNLLATLLIIPTLLLVGENLFRPASIHVYLLLLASGVFGIGIGDTLLFMSLNMLGAGLSGIVTCIYSPFIIGLSVIILKESLSPIQIFGAALIVAAVFIATFERKQSNTTSQSSKPYLGIILGIIAAASSAIGIVMIKPILDVSPLIWATQIRLFGGIMTLVLVFLINSRRKILYMSLTKAKKWSYTIIGSIIGTYFAMIVWLAGMKLTQASVASALNQTSTVFIFIFAFLMLKEPINKRRIVAILFAVAGSYMVSFG